ncbi:hypothetical protein J6590_065574 [Homalodisca vitripennis]|nr:hypothetical protein J6590_065574 [Homalodisca vitripennis]
MESHYCRASTSLQYLEPMWESKAQLYREYTVEDILQFLEGNTDALLTATVYTEPPENFLQSDEDSTNEEENDINRLTSNQLRAPAQLQYL